MKGKTNLLCGNNSFHGQWTLNMYEHVVVYNHYKVYVYLEFDDVFNVS